VSASTPDTINSHPIGVSGEASLVDQVRELIAQARQAGRPAPGRPTLVRLTGATDHQVRRALADLASDAGDTPAVAGGAGGDRVTSTTPAMHAGGGLSALAGPQVGARDGAGVQDSPAPPAPAPPDHQPPLMLGPGLARVESLAGAGRGAGVPGGRLVAWAGFVFGAVMSIAGNVLHAWQPPAHAATGWHPGIAPQIGAAVWPIALLLSVEVLSRIHWPKGRIWLLAPYAGASTVALGSATISYQHLRAVLDSWGYGHPGADVGPLVLDGLMVISGFALLALGGHRTNHHSTNSTR
jgi:hypothetical protein